MSCAREQYRRERSPKVGQPIDAYLDRYPDYKDLPPPDAYDPDYEDLPSLWEIFTGLAFMVALAAGLWLLPFVADALRGVR